MIEAFSSESREFVGTNVLDIVGWRAALLVALLVESRIRVAWDVIVAASGAPDYGQKVGGSSPSGRAKRNRCSV